jgi:hypothetical protein
VIKIKAKSRNKTSKNSTNATIDLNSEHINCKKKEEIMRIFISISRIAVFIYILSSIAIFTANGSDFLPSGWVMYSSEGKSYYYNQQTGVTQWERPLGTSPSNRDQNSGVLFIIISLLLSILLLLLLSYRCTCIYVCICIYAFIYVYTYSRNGCWLR